MINRIKLFILKWASKHPTFRKNLEEKIRKESEIEAIAFLFWWGHVKMHEPPLRKEGNKWLSYWEVYDIFLTRTEQRNSFRKHAENGLAKRQ